MRRNTSDIREIELIPEYLTEHKESDMKTELFGHTYDAPFGIAPVGLQGLMWPKAPEILAKAAGAEFAFMGRAFMYGVAALGDQGGNHKISILKRQLQQVTEQICCKKVEDFPKHIHQDGC